MAASGIIPTHICKQRLSMVIMGKRHRKSTGTDTASFVITSRDNAQRYEAKNDARRLRKRRKRQVIGGIFALLAVAFVGIGAWFIHISTQMSNSKVITEELRQTLEPTVQSDDPFYMLLLGTDGRPGETAYRSDTIVLARIDPGRKQATLISIPRDTRVELDGYFQKINASHTYGGAQGVVEAVNELCDVRISHYAEVSFDGLVQVVDALGGVEVDVPDRISDHKAGDYIIEPGLQVLNGEQALTFCRSRKFTDGDYSRMRHQRIFLQALAKTLLEKTNATNVVGLIESLSSTVATDMSVADIAGLINSMRGMDTDAIYSANIPSTTANIDGVSYVIADEVALKDMMDRVDAGMDPGDSETMETTEEYTANQANGYVDSDGDGVLDDGGIDDGYASGTSVDSGY